MNFAILAAGGKGIRLQAMISKQLAPVCGKPLLIWSLQLLQASTSIHEIIVAHPPDERDSVYLELLEQWKIKKARLVAGGASRFESVRNAFESISSTVNDDFVVIHDAARPMLDETLLMRVLQAAYEKGAVVPALQITETVKEIEDGRVLRTLNRERMFVAQTPQAFRYSLLREAYRINDAGHGGIAPTDEALLAEQSGFTVYCVDGDKKNIKVTQREDIALAEFYLRKGGQ